MKEIIINKKKYNFFYGDIFELIDFCNNYDKYKTSLIELMKIHRDRKFELIDFVIESYRLERSNKLTTFLLIYDNNEIITISRLIKIKKYGYINTVHTNYKFRGMGFCKRNLRKIINLSKDKFNITKFKLQVDIKNTPAISCYKSVGFEIVKELDGEYEMDLIL